MTPSLQIDGEPLPDEVSQVEEPVAKRPTSPWTTSYSVTTQDPQNPVTEEEEEVDVKDEEEEEDITSEYLDESKSDRVSRLILSNTQGEFQRCPSLLADHGHHLIPSSSKNLELPGLTMRKRILGCMSPKRKLYPPEMVI